MSIIDELMAPHVAGVGEDRPVLLGGAVPRPTSLNEMQGARPLPPLTRETWGQPAWDDAQPEKPNITKALMDISSSAATTNNLSARLQKAQQGINPDADEQLAKAREAVTKIMQDLETQLGGLDKTQFNAALAKLKQHLGAQPDTTFTPADPNPSGGTVLGSAILGALDPNYRAQYMDAGYAIGRQNAQTKDIAAKAAIDARLDAWVREGQALREIAGLERESLADRRNEILKSGDIRLGAANNALDEATRVFNKQEDLRVRGEEGERRLEIAEIRADVQKNAQLAKMGPRGRYQWAIANGYSEPAALALAEMLPQELQQLAGAEYTQEKTNDLRATRESRIAKIKAEIGLKDAQAAKIVKQTDLLDDELAIKVARADAYLSSVKSQNRKRDFDREAKAVEIATGGYETQLKYLKEERNALIRKRLQTPEDKERIREIGEIGAGIANRISEIKSKYGFGDGSIKTYTPSYARIARPKAAGTHEDLRAFATQHGFEVTDGKAKSGHNPGSLHYKGRALDVRTRNKTPEQIDAFINAALEAGFGVVDERVKPSDPKIVWTGPHLHLETAPPMTTRPRHEDLTGGKKYGPEAPSTKRQEMNQRFR